MKEIELSFKFESHAGLVKMVVFIKILRVDSCLFERRLSGRWGKEGGKEGVGLKANSSESMDKTKNENSHSKNTHTDAQNNETTKLQNQKYKYLSIDNNNNNNKRERPKLSPISQALINLWHAFLLLCSISLLEFISAEKCEWMNDKRDLKYLGW